jgi:hypothetical protein
LAFVSFAIRHARPFARCGSATATSWPRCVTTLELGPAGSAPTGGEVAFAGAAAAARAIAPAKTAPTLRFVVAVRVFDIDNSFVW